MKAPKQIAIDDYDYPLPTERIAKFPLKNRDESKLLVYREGAHANICILSPSLCHFMEVGSSGKVSHSSLHKACESHSNWLTLESKGTQEICGGIPKAVSVAEAQGLSSQVSPGGMESISRTLLVLALFDSFLEHLDEISLPPLESYPSLPPEGNTHPRRKHTYIYTQCKGNV